MEVIWTQEALERLEDIQYYPAVQEKAPQAARDTLDRIFAGEPQIHDMPQSGRIVLNYNIPNLRELIEGLYRIVYLIQPDRILVVSVMHQSRLLTKVKEMKAAADVVIKAVKEKRTQN